MAVNIKKDFGNNRKKPDLTTLVYGKLPPQAPEMEEAVLGAILLEKDRVIDVFNILPTEDCFYVDANQKIYAAIRRAYDIGLPIDMLTIMNELVRSGELEIIGGAYYLTKLTMSVVSSAHVEAHAKMIMEKYLAREAIRLCGQAIAELYDGGTDVFDSLSAISTGLSTLQETTITSEAKHIGDLSREVTHETAEARQSDDETNAVSTGFKNLDDVLGGGAHEKRLIILAARPAVGKTSFILNLAANMANSQGKKSPGAIFSLEMPFKELVQRTQSAATTIKLKCINQPKLMGEQEFLKYQQADGMLAQMPIYIDDNSRLTLNSLRIKVRKLKNKHKIKWVMIDYLQLMQGDGSGNREQEISAISRGLKAMAKEEELCVIALSQLNRELENRKDNRPKLSDLRESGAIEQDADQVILMSRASAEEEEKAPQLKGVVEFNVAKNRHGSTEKIDLFFERDIQKWHNSNPYGAFDFGGLSHEGIDFKSKLPDGNWKQLPPEKEDDNLPF